MGDGNRIIGGPNLQKPTLGFQTKHLKCVVAELLPRGIRFTSPCRHTGCMSKPLRARYRTTNSSSYNASLRKRGSLLIWMDKDMTWRVPRDGRPGRPAVFSDTAIQFCWSGHRSKRFRPPNRRNRGKLRIALMNRFSALGTAEIIRLAPLQWRKAHSGLRPKFCNNAHLKCQSQKTK